MRCAFPIIRSAAPQGGDMASRNLSGANYVSSVLGYALLNSSHLLAIMFDVLRWKNRNTRGKVDIVIDGECFGILIAS